jgi:hypothetical protein
MDTPLPLIPQTDVMNDTNWLIAVYQYPHTHTAVTNRNLLCVGKRGKKKLQDERKTFNI